MLFDKLKALQITIDDLNVENFPGQWFTKMLDISAIFMLFDFKNSNIIMEILSKFSLLFEYSLV